MLKSVRIYRSLRSRVLSGDLEPGVRLKVRPLAIEYDTSDIPVREALRMLQADGLIEFDPYRGASVIRLSPDDVEEGYLIRGHLESLATRTAVGHVSREQFERLEELIERMDHAAADEDYSGYATLNREFHQAIFDASPYRRLRDLIENLWEGQHSFGIVFDLAPQLVPTSLEEHRQIVAALRDEDVELAADLALRHKMGTSRALVAALRAQEESAPAGSGADGEPVADQEAM